MARTVHSEAYRSLVARLAAARSAAGMTQQALADRLGRPQSFVAKVEGCERRIDVIEFLQIARAVGVDPMPMIKDAWAAI